ncbi:mitotic apparatus protein p62 [Halyomorpha halys]|uniref:mitotic apparatus protein p62 n=1 Tax=Halyomorpha halys TaxID=286706 RepID=UPI0006D4D572|nr:mitotic apparatus protein p62-like [Halyomorpha halys]
MVEEPRSHFWAITLDSSNRQNVWNPQIDTLCREHQLSIKHIMVEGDRQDIDLNIVEIEVIGYKEQPIKFPVAIMVGKRTLMKLNLFFPNPPIIFNLVRGSGPVHLLGIHVINMPEEEISRNSQGLGRELEFVVVDEDEDSEEQEEILEKSDRRERKRTISQSNITKIRKKARNE